MLIPIAASGVMLAQQVDRVQTFQMRMPAPAGQVVSDRIFVNGGPGPLQITQFTRSMKGAPYSAESTTESVQLLADGNRIVTKSTTKTWRDSEGRTRMENNISPVGMWVPEGKNVTLTTIDDPTTGTHYTFNSADKTATKFVVHRSEGVSGTTKHVTVTADSTSASVVSSEGIPMSGNVGVIGAEPARVMFRTTRDNPPDVKREDLGQKNIEGVICDGVKETFTIPAGQMGNERPIEIVTERWSSKELGMDILRKHSDPRNGETTFRVQNLVRGEQPRNLFELPADVKLEEVNTDVLKRKIDLELRQKVNKE
jgi:hypothetical protein